MPAPFADRLLAAIAAKGAPICIGLDPMPDKFPPELRPADPRNLGRHVDAVRRFGSAVLRAIADVAPAVKLQSAYFERYLAPGVAAYYDLVAEAQSLGLLVIGDVKRGDIGPTSQAYADAHLSPLAFDDVAAATPDAITINPFLGLDAIDPFVQAARAAGRGVFVLVRTSNPGSRDVQDLRLANGLTLSEHLADALAAVADTFGGNGDYTGLGAVVGATQPHTMASLRTRLPRSLFLLPGYGTQGATADMTRAAFDANGRGAIVSASRSVLYPNAEPGEPWPATVRRAAIAMRDDLATIVG